MWKAFDVMSQSPTSAALDAIGVGTSARQLLFRQDDIVLKTFNSGDFVKAVE
jgi:hypothetical protein